MRPEKHLRFEATNELGVAASARGTGYSVALDENGLALTLLDAQHHGVASVGLHLVGARQAVPVLSGQLPGVSNYFLGNHAAAWRGGVPGFARATCSNVLPGVDVVYYGTDQGELEYDLVLAPGVDPAGLELAVDGAKSVRLSPTGDALLELPGDIQLIKRAPVAYQVVDGQRSAVAARYELRDGHLGFVVGDFDGARPLIIDPVLSYASFLGAQNYDELFAVASDANGNTYVAGYTTGILFPTVTPQQGTYAGGASDAVVCKLNPAGSAFVYCTYLGGNNADQAYAIATDAGGNTYVTGVTYSTNFPLASAVQGAPGGGGLADAFVAKLNPSGGVLLYSTYLGGSQDEFPRGIAVNAAGNPFITGVTFSPDFPLQAALDASLGGGSDAFLTSLTPTGSGLAFSTFIGGSLDEYGNAVSLTPSGDAFIVGSTNSTNFPTVAPLQAAFAGGARDAFVSRINGNGTALSYSSYLGGRFTDEALAVTAYGDAAVVAGSTTSNDFPVVAAAQLTLGSAGQNDGFISRFAPNGASLSFSSYVGGSGNDVINGVAIDSKGNSYVAGQTTSSNLSIVNGVAGQLTYHGAGDAFVAAYNGLGAPAYSGYIGGMSLDRAAGISVSIAGQVHVAGSTQSVDFPSVNASQPTQAGSQDGFILRFPSLATPSTGVPAVSDLQAVGLAVLLLAAFALYRKRGALAPLA